MSGPPGLLKIMYSLWLHTIPFCLNAKILVIISLSHPCTTGTPAVCRNRINNDGKTNLLALWQNELSAAKDLMVLIGGPEGTPIHVYSLKFCAVIIIF